MHRPTAIACLAGALVLSAGLATAQQTLRQQHTPTRQTDRQMEHQMHRDQHRDARHAQDREATLRGMRVAILTGEGLHDGETLMPMAYLQNRGATVTVIGLEPGLVSAYNSDIEVRIEQSVRDVRPEHFDALVLPGGRAPSDLREESEVVEFAKAFFETGRPVAAICHGPQILARADVLDGLEATCIESISDEIKEAGAEYTDKEVVRDGNLITSRVPEDIPAFVAKLEKTMIEHAEERRRAIPAGTE